jgi:hypothetical protein
MTASAGDRASAITRSGSVDRPNGCPAVGRPRAAQRGHWAAMIQEVDQALEALVRREALNGSRVEVLFDAPTKDWVARRNAPTLDIYLYDIREDTARRQIVPELVRDQATHVGGQKRMPPRRFRLSYLVTAWTQRPEDEHRILSACLAAFVRNETIPAELVAGSLSTSDLPVILTVGMPVGPDRTIADVWSAMGGELKPSLDLVATAPLDANWTWSVAAPVTEGPTLGTGGPGMDLETRQGGPYGGRRGGRAIGPDDAALQEELVRRGAGGGVGSAMVEERASRKGPGRAKGAPAGGGEDGEPDLSSLGTGRLIRVRGIPRP